jgi:beta-phosphoglucomutase
MPLRAAVFDFDGVIVDSEPLHFRSLRDALKEDGVEITEDEYWGFLLAYDDRGAIRLALERREQAADAERVERAASRKAARFANLLPEVPVFPGAVELVRALAARVPVGIASGARHDEVDLILQSVGLRDAFTAIVGVEDAPRTKPDPAPYLRAVTLLASPANGLAPAHCVAFEDSTPGLASALAAGMKVVGITNSYPADKLQAAHRVVASLAGVDVDSLRGLFED